MKLKKLLFASVAALALTNAAFAAARPDPLEERRAKDKALCGHSAHTGMASIEEWRTLLSDFEKIERPTGKPMLEGQDAIEAALNQYIEAITKRLSGEAEELTAKQLLNNLASACIQATLAGSPKGTTALVITAEFMEKSGIPSGFEALYAQLTESACSQLGSMGIGTESERQHVIDALKEHATRMGSLTEDRRLLHMATAGNTVAADDIWAKKLFGAEWLAPWNELSPAKQGTFQKLAENGSRTFQGLLVSAIFKDRTFDPSKKMAVLEKLSGDGVVPASDYLAALYLAEIDIIPETLWSKILSLSDTSVYARDLLANILTGGNDPVTGKTRSATVAFKKVMREAADVDDAATPYQTLLALARSREQNEWYTKAALRIALSKDEWAGISNEDRWAELEGLVAENPVVMNVMVGALESTDPAISMGWSVKSPQERYGALGMLVNAQNAQAAELF